MKVIKSILLLVLPLFICAVTFGQEEVIIRGRVLDKTEGVSVIGANVVEYDKDNRVINGTVCDVNGDFVLEMKDVKHCKSCHDRI